MCWRCQHSFNIGKHVLNVSLQPSQGKLCLTGKCTSFADIYPMASPSSRVAAGPVRLASQSFFSKTPNPSVASKLYIAHGLLGNAMNWSAASKRLLGHPLLAQTVHSALSVDMRNHGNSPHHPSHSNAALASDLEAVILSGQRELAQRNNIEPNGHAQHSVLIGHSMGGLALFGLLLRRYNEEALFQQHSVTNSPQFGEWSDSQRRECSESMRTVNEAFGFGQAQPLRDVLFHDPQVAPTAQSAANSAQHIPLHGRIAACIIVDICPTVRLSNNPKLDEGAFQVLDSMNKVNLDAIHSYSDAREELIRVGIKEKVLRDFVATNIVLNQSGKDGPASWRCNLHALLNTYGEFVPDIVRWFDSKATEVGGCTSSDVKHITPQLCTLPTLFVFGSNSEYNNLEKRKQLKRFFSNVEEVVVQGSGHFVHYEKMEDFVQVTAPFIAKHIR